jgi:hypothetical protein
LKRFFFHVVKDDTTVVDEMGKRLPDLGAVVAAAEQLALRVIISEGARPEEWTHWKLDVKDDDGTRLFFYPFDEVSVHELSEAASRTRGSG